MTLGIALSVVCPFPEASGIIATAHLPSLNDSLVGIVPDVNFGLMVLDQIPAANDCSDFDLHNHAVPGLFDISRKCRYCLSTTGPVTGVLFYLCGGRLCSGA